MLSIAHVLTVTSNVRVNTLGRMAVRAVRKSGGSGDFGRVIHGDLLKDILRPPPGSLPSNQQVACQTCSRNLRAGGPTASCAGE